MRARKKKRMNMRARKTKRIKKSPAPLRDVIRALFERAEQSNRQLAEVLEWSHESIRRYRQLVTEQGQPWAFYGPMKNSDLDACFNIARHEPYKLQPNFDEFHAAMQSALKPTRWKTWKAFRDIHGRHTIGYSRCSSQYSVYLTRLNPEASLTHTPGEEVQVDYAGDHTAELKRPYFYDAELRQKRYVELFVAVMGHSRLAFGFCGMTQTIPDWLDANDAMLAFLGGVPKRLICDRLPAAVNSQVLEPEVRAAFREWGEHNRIHIDPARAYSPCDKALVENGVRYVRRFLLEELEKNTYYSLDEINDEVRGLLADYNGRPFDARPGSRQSVFDAEERALLQPLPPERFIHREWTGRQIVRENYRVAVDGDFYSVPPELIGQPIEARFTHDQVQIFYRGDLVAEHARTPGPSGRDYVDPAHLAPNHRAWAEGQPAALQAWADGVGPATGQMVRTLFGPNLSAAQLKPVRELRQLAQDVPDDEFEKAAMDALTNGLPHPTGVKRILKANRQSAAVAAAPAQSSSTHEPQRGTP